jgi:hypothetical protein
MLWITARTLSLRSLITKQNLLNFFHSTTYLLIQVGYTKDLEDFVKDFLWSFLSLFDLMSLQMLARSQLSHTWYSQVSQLLHMLLFTHLAITFFESYSLHLLLNVFDLPLSLLYLACKRVVLSTQVLIVR